METSAPRPSTIPLVPVMDVKSAGLKPAMREKDDMDCFFSLSYCRYLMNCGVTDAVLKGLKSVNVEKRLMEVVCYGRERKKEAIKGIVGCVLVWWAKYVFRALFDDDCVNF